jgi:anti-sigma regulatory factor (Ser/Thr protein kinase)
VASSAERIRLRIADLGKAVLVSGQAYQDPKDALNEFVSNAADEYAEAGIEGGRIRIVLRRRGQRPYLAVEDEGRGMDVERLRTIARSLFSSAKAGDDRTLGEKAIGMLAFQQLGARCEIVTRTSEDAATHSLRLERGSPRAMLEANERRRRRTVPGTTVYLLDLEPEVLRMMTQRKVVDYLRRRRGPALAAGAYSIVVEEGRAAELVTPEEPEGMRLDLPTHPTLWGRIEFNLYVTPSPDRRRRVVVVGRAGTTIIDDLCELDELDHAPWSSDQVSGQVSFEALAQTAGRRAILRDRDAFPVFVDAVTSVEPLVRAMVDRVAAAVDAETAERLSDTVRRVFSRVLKELADLDNPMRTYLGSEPGEGGLLVDVSSSSSDDGRVAPPGEDLPRLPEPLEPAEPPEPLVVSDAQPDRSRARGLPTVLPDPEPGEARSRFDAEAGVVLYNDRHQDYLWAKDDEGALLDYLATLVAKEYVVYNNPRAAADELAEEMVRMLIRVRRHLPRRR